MAWYYGTYACGHEGRVNIIGPHSSRQWIADRKFEGLCPECYQKELEIEREAINDEAQKRAEEMELPELKGTEKQVAWANTIRIQFIDGINELIEKAPNTVDDEDIEKVTNSLNEIMQYMITRKIDASWYIDNRYSSTKSICRTLYSLIEKEKREAAEKKDIEKVKVETTIRPENAITNIPVEIKILEGEETKVIAIYEKNEKFREIVKNLGYKWNGIWEKEINQTTGTAVDRAAELGNKLLNAGFPVTIANKEAREKAVAGTYEPECKRWIFCRTKGNYKGWLVVNWEGYDDNLYKAARSLPGSRWDSPSVVVNPQHFEEIEDFARLYGFRFTEKAAEAIEKAKEAFKNSQIVNPAKVVETETNEDGLKKILESSDEIIEDLKD